MGSVRQIAKRTGVSIATVSRVLNDAKGVNEETRQKVLEAVNESGYIRRVGRRAVTEGIALAYAGPGTIASPFDQGLLAGIGRSVADAEAGEDFGHDLLIVNLKRVLRPKESPSSLFRRKGIKGAILRTTDEGLGLCRRLAGERFPTVVAGSRLDEGDVAAGLSWVDGDSTPASREAVEHLIQLGHRRISIVANFRDDTDHRDRIHGWSMAMQAAGLPAHHGTDDEPFPNVVRIRANYEAGDTLARRWLAAPPEVRPTALYIADPMPALGLLRAAYDHGITVPGDLSIVGFDDGGPSGARQLTFPPMAAVYQDSPGIGEAAVDLLRIRMADNVRKRDDVPVEPEPQPVHKKVLPVFLTGATVGPVPRKPSTLSL
jgi:LacI family transcriptional regulator